jgi:uncharacterized lipoprotein YddW (UPF0748 family)
MSTLPALRARDLVALLTFAVLAACAGDSIGPVLSPSAADRTQHVTLSESDVVLMVRTPSAPVGERGGTSVQLDAGIFNKKGKVHPNKQEKFYEWVSSDPGVATVDTAGLVTAVGVGSALVIVDYKDMTDTLTVTVIPVPVASLTVAGPDSLSLADTASYTAVTRDSVGEPLVGRAVAWTSGNPAALAIGASDGVAIANAVGTVIITASSEGKDASIMTKVWVQPVATIEVIPASQTVALYRPASFSAVLRDRRGTVVTGRVVTWRSTATEVFTIDGISGVVTTVAPGTGDAIADAENRSGAGTLVVTNPVEARALWVNRFDYTNAASIANIMQKAGQARFNMVYFQVRGIGDAFYRSTIEPCAYALCGTLGGGTTNAVPPFDPLAVAITEAAKYGIEVHAWLNSYTGWVAGSATNCARLIESTPRHMLKANPSWIMTDRNRVPMPCATSSEYIWVSPGFPGVRSQLAHVAADIARNYAVKGIHLDRIRYPGTAWSYDTSSVNTWDRANGLAIGTLPPASSSSFNDFRRAMVNQGVREVYDSIRAVRPSLVLSAAVWPIYKTPPGWSTGFSRGYDDLFQDTRTWTGSGFLDVAVPMTYPGSTTSVSYTVKPTYCASLDWECLLDDHRRVIEDQHHRFVYIGVGAIKGWDEMDRQLAIARRKGVTGISIYNYGTIRDQSPTAWTNLANGYFKYPATVPAMPWKQ